MWTYQIYLSTDISIDRYNRSRESFNCNGQDGYVLSKDGVPAIIQFEQNYPYPASRAEQAAQLHVNALNAEDGQTQEM